MRPGLRTQAAAQCSFAKTAREEARRPGTVGAARPASSGGRGADPPTRLPQKPFPRCLQRPSEGLALPRRRETHTPPHYLIRAATLMLGAVRVRAAGTDARPGPRSGSSDARGSSPGCLLRCLSATILLPLQHLAEQTGVQGRQSQHMLPATWMYWPGSVGEV